MFYLLMKSDLPMGSTATTTFADSRKDTGVRFGQDRLVMIENCDLIVSNNRLFLINQSLKDLSRLDESMVDQRGWHDIIYYADYWSK